jgi:hypothetical protein
LAIVPSGPSTAAATWTEPAESVIPTSSGSRSTAELSTPFMALIKEPSSSVAAVSITKAMPSTRKSMLTVSVYVTLETWFGILVGIIAGLRVGSYVGAFVGAYVGEFVGESVG